MKPEPSSGFKGAENKRPGSTTLSSIGLKEMRGGPQILLGSPALAKSYFQDSVLGLPL